MPPSLSLDQKNFPLTHLALHGPEPCDDTLLFGRYRVIRQLGRGSMGLVLLARDNELQEDIAIKLIPDLLMKDPVALGELKQEVQRVMALTHPGIIRTQGFTQDEKMAAVVMEHVVGENLHDLRQSHPEGCFHTKELFPWLEQLCPVLDHAHFEMQIVHRDLKLRQMILTSTGQIKVADFGISSIINDTISRLPMRSVSSGDFAYKSPQQIMGDRASHLDDIYALGATLYELLTSKPPFYEGHVLSQVLQCQPVPMAERRKLLGITGKEPIPPNWEAIVAACLAKEAWQRPQSAGEVMNWLRPATAIQLTTYPIHQPQITRTPYLRTFTTPWIATFSLTCAAAAAFFFMDERPNPPVISADETATANPQPHVAKFSEPPVLTSPKKLPQGHAGIAYKHQLTSSGDTEPCVWSSETPLPRGIALSTDGELSGIPARAEKCMLSVKVTDKKGLSDTQTFILTILEKEHSHPFPDSQQSGNGSWSLEALQENN